jgi:hypothetical protein
MSTKTIGELLALLKPYTHTRNIEFDFCGMKPTSVRSWRGSYDCLAIEPEEPKWANHVTVADLIKTLEQAKHRLFDGYKGGEFYMDDASQVWVDRWGESTCTGIVGIGTHPMYDYEGCTLIIQTAPMVYP